MYGLLELADAWRDGVQGGLVDCDRQPHIAQRGIKFNLPLDLRTPSYSDTGEAAQLNIPTIWEVGFWRDFLDEMARDRFNVLTLWNLHPFPSLVRVPEYPEVALDDVWRTTLPFDTTFSLCGEDMLRPAMLEQHEVVKRIGIDGKIAFWRSVMQQAHERGIAVYIFTWNIFTYGAEGKHGITCDQENPVTLDYFRRSVRELVLTYPLLAGIGLTAGENMREGSSVAEREIWLRQAYGEGVADALSLQPGRSVRIIHRAHQTSFTEIHEAWRDHPGPFDLSFKYAIARMYASPTPPFANEALPTVPEGLRLWMTVRNDDIHCYRWGEPAFARAFIRHLPGPERCAGFYLGPDGHTWGNDTLSRQVDPAWPQEILRHWYAFRIWGLLAYNPDLPDGRFTAMLGARLPGVDPERLATAWAAASRIIPTVNRAYWNPLDFQFLPEACHSHPVLDKGFHRVDHLMLGTCMPGTANLSVSEFCAAEAAGGPIAGITPPQVIASLRADADAALTLLAGVGETGDDELARVSDDLRAMALLGRYYAAKLSGALELGRLVRSGDPARREAALNALEEALERWRTYAALADRRYQPRFYTRIGPVDLIALTASVADDLRIARDWPVAPTTTPGGPHA